MKVSRYKVESEAINLVRYIIEWNGYVIPSYMDNYRPYKEDPDGLYSFFNEFQMGFKITKDMSAVHRTLWGETKYECVLWMDGCKFLGNSYESGIKSVLDSIESACSYTWFAKEVVESYKDKVSICKTIRASRKARILDNSQDKYSHGSSTVRTK